MTRRPAYAGGMGGIGDPPRRRPAPASSERAWRLGVSCLIGIGGVTVVRACGAIAPPTWAFTSLPGAAAVLGMRSYPPAAELVGGVLNIGRWSLLLRGVFARPPGTDPPWMRFSVRLFINAGITFLGMDAAVALAELIE